MKNKQILIDILSAPSFVGKEEHIRTFLADFLNKRGINNYEDKYGNIYATKGNADRFPCVLAHIDTVHPIESFNVIEEANNLFAQRPNGIRCGIGGDDKAGVFICLELLEHFDNIKVAFFVSEEVGCLGSYLSDESFFENVGYAIQFDAPGNNWITQYCDGIKLFNSNEDDEFFNKIETVFLKHTPNYMRDNLGIHPFTDVKALKSLYDFTCLNYSAGYHRMHSVNEYVSLDDVDICLNVGIKLIEALGEKLYFMPRATVLLSEDRKTEIEFQLKKWKIRP